MENRDGKGLIGHRLAKKEVVRVEKVDDRGIGEIRPIGYLR